MHGPRCLNVLCCFCQMKLMINRKLVFFFNFAAVSSPSFCFSLCRSPSSPPLRPTPPLPPSPWSHWFALGDVHISSGAFCTRLMSTELSSLPNAAASNNCGGAGRCFFKIYLLEIESFTTSLIRGIIHVISLQSHTCRVRIPPLPRYPLKHS